MALRVRDAKVTFGSSRLILRDTIRPVGSGKTALMLAMCLALRNRYEIAAVTNDIFTREDCESLTKRGATAGGVYSSD